MVGQAELETRIRVLEDIEAIRKLKFRYWWSLDNKLWDELADCFTEDLAFQFSSIKKEGREAFVQFARESADRASVTTAHQGHQSRIEITSETTANGKWAFRDHIGDSQENTEFKGRGYYEEEYVKENGKWKIRSMKIAHIFAEEQQKGCLPSVTPR